MNSPLVEQLKKREEKEKKRKRKNTYLQKKYEMFLHFHTAEKYTVLLRI